MSFTLQEIQNQPKSMYQTLQWMEDNWATVFEGIEVEPQTCFAYVGCGTSYFLAKAAAKLNQRLTGHTSVALPASDVFTASDECIPRGVPLVVVLISRSGTTSEVLFALEHLKPNFPEANLIGVTCSSKSDMAVKMRHVISLDHAAEDSVVMTQSFTNMLFALQYMSAKIAGREDMVSELQMSQQWLEAHRDEVETFGRNLANRSDVSSWVYLGIGPLEGVALEGMLKLKEMTQIPSESFNTLEFRHGPISVIRSGHAAIVLRGAENRKVIEAVMDDIKQFGGQVIDIGPGPAYSNADSALSLPDDISDWARATLYTPALQFLAYYQSLRVGTDPDQPRNLTQSVIIEMPS